MVNNDGAAITLDEWERALLPSLRNEKFAASPIGNATLLAYFFWDDERIETKFYAMECAFLCAWKSWGMMPSVLVVNKRTPTIDGFAERHGVKLQIDPTLTGGLPRMSLDCVHSLYKRFETEYVVIIQMDGMPVRAGLEAFLGKYDYVGAPWPGHCGYDDWFPYPRFGVGNGGFSLRSKKICEQAAKSYNSFWRFLPYSMFVQDDMFYCKTMPFLSSHWRKSFRYPSIEEAIRFSLESVPPCQITQPPLGFHSSAGFRYYIERFGVPFQEML